VQQAAAWQQAGDPQAATARAARQEPAATTEAPAEFPRGETAQPRRSFTDITSSSHFAHAADFSWLAGQVEKTRLGNGWRLRYASVDEDDPHGGSVSLSGDANLPILQDGQYIRVRGHLVDPEAQGAAPAYHVESAELLVE
jgi:hypothetical protein